MVRVNENKGIEMEKYRPYRKMASTCRTRPTREKRVVWSKVESEPFLEGRYQVRTLRRELIGGAAELWYSAYPELYGSPHEFLLDPDQYESRIALEETWEEDAATKVYCMMLVEELQTGKVVSATLLTKYEKNLQVEYTFAATHPDYRKMALTDELRRATRKVAYGSGAEYLTTFCETWHDITQNWCIRGGWKIAGVFPGRFIRWNGKDEEYRGCTIHFYRFIGDGEEHSTRPEEWHLAEPVKRLWETLAEINLEIEKSTKPA